MKKRRNTYNGKSLLLNKDSKLYGDYCENNNDCDSSGNFICDKNRCSCATTNWYSDTQCGKNAKLFLFENLSQIKLKIILIKK